MKFAVGVTGFLVLITVLGDGAGNALCVLSIVGLIVWLFATAGPIEPARRPLAYVRRPAARRRPDRSGADRFTADDRDRYDSTRRAEDHRSRWSAPRDRRDSERYADERRHFSRVDHERQGSGHHPRRADDRDPRERADDRDSPHRRTPFDDDRWSRIRREDR